MSARTRWIPAAAMALVLANVAPAKAAKTARRAVWGQQPTGAPRQYSGGAVFYGTPNREFGDQVGNGFGLDAVGSNALNTSGITRIRSDITLLYHRNHDQAVPSAQLAPGDQMSLGTSANLFHILIGPEIAVPSGRFRPYLFGVAGYGSATIRQQLDGRINAGADPYHLDASRHTSMLTWGTGVGVRVQAGSALWLDLGAEYRDAMGARMITPSRVSTSPGAVVYSERDVDAEQFLFRVGFARAPH